MKFTAAVVVLALVAVSANASPLWGAGPVVSVDVSAHHGLGLGHGLGWAGHGVGLGAIGHPALITSGHGVGIGHGLLGHGIGGPALVQGIGAHGVIGHGIGAHGVIGHGVGGPALVHGIGAHGVHGVHGHEAGYVAANRGSVHVAPLVGHIASASSINTAPAPGTNW